MVAHEDIGVEKERVAVLANSKGLDMFLIICDIFEYLLAFVAAGNGVME
jgi:hypothetical protein